MRKKVITVVCIICAIIVIIALADIGMDFYHAAK